MWGVIIKLLLLKEINDENVSLGHDKKTWYTTKNIALDMHRQTWQFSALYW